MSIMIYHAKEPTFFAKAKSVKVRELIDDYAMVATVDTTDKNVAYELTNSINQGWWLNDGVKFHGSPDHGMDGCRSTSVGDIMVVGKDGADGVTTYETFQVAGCGFTKLAEA